MTQQTKGRIIAWIVAVGAMLPAIAWADSRYVHRDEFVVRVILDSMNNATTQKKLDDILTRLTQIECGAKVLRGCR